MKKFLSLLALLTALFGTTAARAQSIDNITFLTENYPPYNFQDGGKLSGIAIDMLDLVFKKLGSSKTANGGAVTMGEWDSAYKRVQTDKNIVLFSMTKTKSRENLFKWAGPIAPTRTVIIAPKAANVKISSTADLNKYKIVAIKSDIGETLAREAGATNITTYTDYKDCIKALENGSVDVWAYEEMGAKWFLKNAGVGAKYDTAYVLQSSDLMFAFSKNVSDSLIAEIQDAIDEMKIDGEYLDITNKYTK